MRLFNPKWLETPARQAEKAVVQFLAVFTFPEHAEKLNSTADVHPQPAAHRSSTAIRLATLARTYP
jgi:hypothetical protein